MERVKIGILNLMYNKIETNQNFYRSLTREHSNVEAIYYYSATRYINRKLDPSITSTMRPLDLDELDQLDGFIITGSPIEHLDFNEVSYKDEVNDLLDKLNQLNIPQLYVCWGAMVALNHFYGVEKKILPHKTFGIFQNKILKSSSLLTNISDHFPAPHARYAEMNQQQINDNSQLRINSVNDKGLLFLAEAIDKPQAFLFSHLEYQRDDLQKEYDREYAAHPENDPIHPENYYSPINQKPMFAWKDVQAKFFGNWINEVINSKTKVCN
ncbi:homoserine O-acetyltransferase/O-succinyltransferase family protein [Companilactobacillus versmoldensis]|uniref:Serine O-acetyltransferase n=1 Tax=Companilactobacillus versmoldensis DSM 14857 = KCTC 3814 TaxID=1423815 RepID=A0A0R1SC43_9LACO|nr:homoserine O-succinyltransferase [Companilactobacillus versmoldensis]KRL66711.1 homoserine o-succinyltransferase [Companilactobacillus versmoldensis DSM 14857 = KCTC 3814]